MIKATRKLQYYAPALEKGLDILELLSQEEEGLSTKEIAMRLNRSVSEIFRMLVVLERREYISLVPNSDLYILSLKMFELSHRFPPTRRLTTVAGPIMRKLSHDIGQSCHLVVYYEGAGHVIVQHDSPSDRIFRIRLGAQTPLITTCSGHVLLAFAEQDMRQMMLAKIPKSHPRENKTALRKIIKRVRDQGYEKVVSMRVSGVTDIGYPIFNHRKEIVAVLVVPFFSYLDHSHPMDLPEVSDRAATESARISAALGCIAN